MHWLKDLVARNRQRGQRPSGLCLWYRLDEMAMFAESLVCTALERQETWESIKARTNCGNGGAPSAGLE